MTTHELARQLLEREELPVFEWVYSIPGVQDYAIPCNSVEFHEIPDPILTRESEDKYEEVKQKIDHKEQEAYEQTGIEQFSILFSDEYCDPELELAHTELFQAKMTIPLVKCLII